MRPYYENNHHSICKIYPVCNLNFSFPPHLHSSVEFFYVLEGTIQANVNDEKRLLKKGDCLLTFPNQIHSYTSETENANKSFLLLFNPYFSESFRQIFQKYHPKSPYLNSEQIHPDVVLSVQKLLSPSTCANSSLSFGWLQIILSHLLSKYTLVENSITNGDETLFKILQYMTENFCEPLTLELLAQNLHINKYYLSHIFSEHLQMNFREYLNALRLDYATQLIQTTNLPLIDIGMNAGFECQATFNRVFKEHFHMTPSQYRKEHSKLILQ